MSSTEPVLSPRRVDRAGLCIGCGACADAGDRISMRFDAYGQLKPRGPGTRGASRALAQVCPFSPGARDEDRIAAERFPDAPLRDPHIGRYEAAYVGHAAELGFREAGSSGGLVTWVACALLRLGLVDGVAHVAPGRPSLGEPLFGYRISRTVEAVRGGAKSRYFPVELSGVLDEMRRISGRYAVVGIPCFVKTANLLRGADAVLHDRIAYTLGLFCGHMKSARMAESFAWQLGAGIGAVDRLDFRRKDPSRPANWYRAELHLDDGSVRARDWWDLADGDWGAGFFQNPACDFCDDVVAETADISFGDAWVEPYASDGRGTNVVVVRDKRLHRVLLDTIAGRRIALDPVDAGFVVRTQAAGFRQRREGLAYRLATHRGDLRPAKRVAALRPALSPRRRAIYASRRRISQWSHRVFWLSRVTGLRRLYLLWARATLRLYQGLAYSRGMPGRLADHIFAPAGGRRPAHTDRS